MSDRPAKFECPPEAFGPYLTPESPEATARRERIEAFARGFLAGMKDQRGREARLRRQGLPRWFVAAVVFVMGVLFGVVGSGS